MFKKEKARPEGTALGKPDRQGAKKNVNKTPIRLVSVDSSFEGFPFFLMSRNRPGRRQEMRFERQLAHYANDEQRLVDQLWEVRASGSLGLPTRWDQDVYFAVHEMIRDRGGIPAGGQLRFSLYELVNRLLPRESGWGYDHVRRSLERIASTTIRSRKAFWSKRSQAFISDTFSIWSFHEADYREGAKGRAAEHHLLRLHPLFVENYEDNHLSEIDSGFYWALEEATSKRLYRLLECYSIGDGGARVWEVDLFELRDLVPLGSYQYASQIKRPLMRAHEELMSAGYLHDVRFQKTKSAPENVRYEVSEQFGRQRVESVLEAAAENQAALEMMKRAGLPRRVRLDALREHEPDLCVEMASLLPHQKGLNNPTGGFIWALGSPEEARQRWWPNIPSRKAPRSRAGAEKSGTEGADEHDTDSVDAAGRTECGASNGDHLGEEVEQQVSRVADPEAEELWHTILDDVSEEINAPSLRVWFEGTFSVAVGEQSLTICVPNSFAKEYIESRFKETIEKALANHLSPTSSLEIVVATSEQV